jgi:hypothetical protein
MGSPAKRSDYISVRRDGLREEKILRGRFTFSKDGRCSRWKGQTGQRPGRGEAEATIPNALRFGNPRFVRDDGDQGREGQRRRETLFFWDGS